MSWSTSELRVRLAPLNRFKPSSKIFYWPFQGGTSFVDLLCFCSVLCLLCFVRVCLYVLCGHLLGKGWPLGSRLWCLLWVCHFPIGILGQVWYLIVSIPDLCTITYFWKSSHEVCEYIQRNSNLLGPNGLQTLKAGRKRRERERERRLHTSFVFLALKHNVLGQSISLVTVASDEDTLYVSSCALALDIRQY